MWRHQLSRRRKELLQRPLAAPFAKTKVQLLRQQNQNQTVRALSLSSSSSSALLNCTSPFTWERGDAKSAAERLEEGKEYHNFRVMSKDEVPEYSVKTIKLEHVPTKAQYLHIDTKDRNNVFCVAFRTPPYSSNGIAHILEHTVLCGSEKFPVRDPFFNMIKRSLNTFMNAMTASDHTMYPFSTTNAQDYRNLMAVYTDAVFFPHLHRLDFLQEGHRLELEHPDEIDTSPLVYKGVVYNEMKGTLSDSSTLFATKLEEELMKGTIYGHVSGGMPSEIPNLTYEEFKNFHKRHYHPSNALFYSYGDLPLVDHLCFLDEHVLNRFQYQNESASIRVDTKTKEFGVSNHDKASVIRVTGPLDGAGVKEATKFCCTRLLGISSTEAFDTFVMRIVAYLLMNGPSSPLYKSLIETKLATDFGVGGGFDGTMTETVFGVGVEGFDEQDLPKIQQAIKETLERVAEEGFEQERVEALLHQIELSSKHVVGNFGLNLLHAASYVWCHRGDPVEHLKLNELLSRFHEEMKANPRFLQDQVAKYLVADTKLKEVQMLMTPDENFVASQEQATKDKLAKIRAQTPKEELIALKQQAEQLNKRQEEEQQVSCLPTLTIKDIPSKTPRVPIEDTTDPASGVSVSHVTNQTTNEISYFRLAFDTSDLPMELKWYLPLFGMLLGQLGTSSVSHEKLNTLLLNCSGGVSCSPATYPALDDAWGKTTEVMVVETLALPHKLETLMKLLHEILVDTQFTSTENLFQMRILLQMAAANALNNISSSGHQMAASRGSVGLTKNSTLQEMYGGLAYVEMLQKWAQASDEELLQIAKVLEAIGKKFFAKDNVRVSIVAEDKMRDRAQQVLSDSLLMPLRDSGAHDASVFEAAAIPSELIPQSCPKGYFGFPTSVNFVVKSLPSVPLLDPDHVPLSVLSQIMSSCFLHQRVREKGGAYGAGAVQGEGTFRMHSYYDPNTWKTMEAFDDAIEWAKAGNFTDRDVQEALLSIFSSIDAPVSPSAKGKMSFVRGITHEMRQTRRHQFLQLTKDQLVEAAQKHLVPNNANSHVVIVGQDNNLEEFGSKDFYTHLLTTPATSN